MLGAKKVDLGDYKRLDQFKHFKELAFPYVGCTVNVDVTNLLEKVRREGIDFFLAILYQVVSAANAVPEFRQRIINGEIWEFDSCKSSHGVEREDFTYFYCNLDYNYELDDFLVYAKEEQEKAREKGINEDRDVESLFYVSTKSWLFRFSLLESVSAQTRTNPRITLGKYVEDEETGRAVMPVSVLCHHALVDDVHIKKFYRELRTRLDQIELEVAA
ncbi:MAG: CatA-like O-acetyltransferase [Lachnospiraceae bacterium]